MTSARITGDRITGARARPRPRRQLTRRHAKTFR